MKYCVALTGTAGSGKSFAAAFFVAQGIEVLSADIIARQLTAPGTLELATIVAQFGEALLTPTGELNRPALRQRIIHNPQERAWLEGLLHPLIRQALATALAQTTSPYAMLEIPLLKHRADYPYIQRVLLIEASKATQITRIMQRDHCTRAHAMRLLAIQANKASYRALADDIVKNNRDEQTLILKLTKLHAFYLAQARNCF